MLKEFPKTREGLVYWKLENSNLDNTTWLRERTKNFNHAQLEYMNEEFKQWLYFLCEELPEYISYVFYAPLPGLNHESVLVFVSDVPAGQVNLRKDGTLMKMLTAAAQKHEN